MIAAKALRADLRQWARQEGSPVWAKQAVGVACDILDECDEEIARLRADLTEAQNHHATVLDELKAAETKLFSMAEAAGRLAAKLVVVEGEGVEMIHLIESLEEAVEESLPTYMIDDGDTEANHVERVEYAGDELKRVKTALARVSGALADAGSVPTEPAEDGVRALTRERDALRENMRKMVLALTGTEELDRIYETKLYAEARALLAEVEALRRVADACRHRWDAPDDAATADALRVALAALPKRTP